VIRKPFRKAVDAKAWWGYKPMISLCSCRFCVIDFIWPDDDFHHLDDIFFAVNVDLFQVDRGLIDLSPIRSIR
jgi:hypothetical protein